MAGSHVDITERKLAAQQLETMNQKLLKREQALRRIIQRLRLSNRELKEAHLQLIQAAKLESVGTLAAGVAHEVKNPLQTIIMGLDHVANQIESPQTELTITIADMRDAVERADEIVRGLLTLASNGEFHLVPESLNRLVERALYLSRPELVSAGVRVLRELTPGLPEVSVDSGKLGQVFINLVLNAIQAMSRGGLLTVRTYRVCRGETSGSSALDTLAATSDLVVAEIQDTGCGITPVDLPRVFDPFFSRKRAGSGSGLGLPVARKIVDMHGGWIGIENSELGGVVATLALKVGTPAPRKPE
jgi:signal transduction histidine kinase